MIKNQIKQENIFKVLYIFFILSLISTLILFPASAISSFYQGIILWATKILPSLLPFLILTKLLSYTDFIGKFGNFISPITKKIYGVGGASGYIFLMSIISGYPIGAKLTSDLYNSRTINSRQAQIITSFTSTSGPLFIIGTVGIGLFNSAHLGVIIIISHLLSALLNGLIYRSKSTKLDSIAIQNTSNNPLSDSMTSSILSIMTIGGFVALFYMVLQLIINFDGFYLINKLLAIFGVDSSLSISILAGLIEVTTGCLHLSRLSIDFRLLACIISFLISFGGISIHAQAYCFLKNFNMPYHRFFLQKLTHAIISTIITLIIVVIFI